MMLRLDIAYLCTKFDHSSFSRSWDMVGAHQNLDGSHDLTTPFLEWFAIYGLALVMINLPTKFQVSNSTQYKDIKGDTKCIHHFLLAFHSNYDSILHHF